MKNKNEKITYYCYLFASLCFYITAIIELFSEDRSRGVLHLCLGSTFLCLSSTYMNIKKK